jgi:hypothetical protein
VDAAVEDDLEDPGAAGVLLESLEVEGPEPGETG